jgi:F-box and WD-40 domain protein MET30
VELATKILTNLDTVSLCKAAQVSHRWRQLADDDAVWHRMCEQHISRKCTKCGWGLPLLERKRLRDWARQQELAKKKKDDEAKKLAAEAPEPAVVPETTPPRSPTPPKREASPQPSSSKRRRLNQSEVEAQVSQLEPAPQPKRPRFKGFKEVYRERWAISSNWKKGRCTAKIFKGHTNGVTCLQFDDTGGFLATGSYDATIKIWDIQTGEERITLRGHTRGIRTLRFDGSKLFSGSLDGSVRIYNWKTGEELSRLQHSDGVISVDFEEDIMVSGCIDKLVRGM